MEKDLTKRFQQIFEYTLNVKNGIVDEADDQPEGGQEQPQGDMGGEPMPQDGGMPGPQDGGMPGPEGQPMGDAQGQGMGGPEGFNPDIPQDNAMPQDGGMPQGDMGEGIPVDNMQPDDEVVDITDLTDSQETTEKKVNALGKEFNDKFQKVFQYLNKFEDMIKANDEALDNLNKEFEKRNPTPVEQLNLRSMHSYPFNISPTDYWAEKEANSNYRISDDNKNQEKRLFQEYWGGLLIVWNVH